MHDVTFASMGTQVRVLVPTECDATAARRWLAAYEARLSRFRAASELSALNRDPRATVPASALLRTAVRAAIQAAGLTGGLVDPTLGRAIAAAGYDRSLAAVTPPSLRLALAAAPRPRRPATPDPARGWTAIEVDDVAGTITRPPGLVLDTGGTGKGLAADLLAAGRPWVVDCGGDVRVGTGGAQAVVVEHPLTGEAAHRLTVNGGAVATSGIARRLWRRNGRPAHHLLDPSTGEPAWTGLISATALAPTALEAEALAKAALLSGPAGARRILAAAGGVLIHDGGDVELLGGARSRPRVRLASVA